MRVPATASTPEVDLTFENDVGWIRGRWSTARAGGLFIEIQHYLHDLIDHDPERRYRIDLDLAEIPSTVLPYLRALFDMLSEKRSKGSAVSVTAYYDADDIGLKNLFLTLNDKYPGLFQLQIRPSAAATGTG